MCQGQGDRHGSPVLCAALGERAPHLASRFARRSQRFRHKRSLRRRRRWGAKPFRATFLTFPAPRKANRWHVRRQPWSAAAGRRVDRFESAAPSVSHYTARCGNAVVPRRCVAAKTAHVPHDSAAGHAAERRRVPCECGARAAATVMRRTVARQEKAAFSAIITHKTAVSSGHYVRSPCGRLRLGSRPLSAIHASRRIRMTDHLRAPLGESPLAPARSG